MWRRVPGTFRALGAVVVIATAAGSLIGAGPLSKNKRSSAPLPKVEESIGDIAFVLQDGEILVEGIGLVSGLENTGGDAPPSWYRSQLVDEMSKAGVEHASKLLESKRFAMVIVRMRIPTGAAPKDRFDIELELPPASAAKSLAGGYLMMTRLREHLMAGGAPKTGSDVALAQGPVMIGNAENPDDPKVGRVLGGGRVKDEYPYRLILMDNKRSVRNAGLAEKVINERFHQNKHGQLKGASTAKSDTYLVLNVPDVYHQNQERFFRVVQLLPMIDTPALRQQRLAATAKELHDPKTAGVAALKLEALGPSAAEALEVGLEHKDPDVRFFAAEALAYLNESAGVDVLGQTAVEQPKYRAYALAALSAMDDEAARVRLRKLMDEPEMEVRYGAFNALRTLDPFDASLGQVRILDDPRDEEFDEDAPDAMAMALALSRRPRAEDPFALYLVDSEGPPAVHISRSRRSEITIFGRGQKLLPPIVLGDGAILLNASEFDDSLDISKIVPSKFGDDDVRVRGSLEIGDVIRRVANLGATYPEIVAILEAADKQKNLPGPLFVDSVPTSNVEYLAKAIMGKDKLEPKKDDDVKRAGGSFLRRIFNFRDRDRDRDEPQAASDDDDTDAKPKPDPDAGKPADATKADDAEKPVDDLEPISEPAEPVAKKDDAVRRTDGAADDSAETERRSGFLDRFRRR